jgi:hypothetical protein
VPVGRYGDVDGEGFGETTGEELHLGRTVRMWMLQEAHAQLLDVRHTGRGNVSHQRAATTAHTALRVPISNSV